MVKVKICGITNIDDALAAAEAGADALGFVFFKGSPRCISPDDAGPIIRKLPPFIAPVGVFVDAGSDFVKEAVRLSGIKVLQFHGMEPPDYCGSFGLPYVKAFRVRDMRSLEGIGCFPAASAFLLDAYSEKEYGGTGEVFNWDVSVSAKKFGRIILAGGLVPGNVAIAVEHVKPYAVDVSSGVEAEKGVKDHAKVFDFIAAAKSAGP